MVGNDILEQEWVEAQTGTYVGVSSLVDVNVVKLAKHPFVAEETMHSIPLLMYGTFWNAYIQESNLNRTRAHPWKVVVRLIYLAGIVPTLLILFGFLRRALDARRLFGELRTGDGLTERLKEVVLLLSLAGASALVVKWGLKHDAWSFFQARLVFPAFLAISLSLAWGLESIERRGPLVRYLTGALLLSLYALIAAYYAIELGAQLVEPTPWPPEPLPSTS